jgi:two-component system, OmpR family, phosphate regulon sensor histidine kinase PhoR
MSFEQNILDALPWGLVYTAQDGIVVFWNKTMADLTGISARQAKGKLIYHWIAELKDLASNTSVPFSREGYWQSFMVNCQDHEGGTLWTFTPEDHLDRVQSDFVSTVSHELRTPLTSIKGFVDTLLRSRRQLPEDQQIRFLRIIKNQADRLTRLVEDILIVSKIQSGQLRNAPQRLDLADVIDRVLENLSQKTAHHQLDLNLNEDLPAVWADQDRLEQILTNLVDNALKYSPKNTVVALKAWMDPKIPGKLSISVVDQGIGIPEAFLEQIFNRFNRLDTPLTREREGTGLGLYITKSLVESLGGQIAVESRESLGSTFTVYLPTAPDIFPGPIQSERGEAHA